MNGAVSHMCLAGAVVASWHLTQKVAGSSPSAVVTNIFVIEFAEFSETFRKNSNVHYTVILFQRENILGVSPRTSYLTFLQ